MYMAVFRSHPNSYHLSSVCRELLELPKNCLCVIGEKAAMLCTASVEEVIDGHYKDQTYKLGKDEEELKKKIMKFRQDELDHKDIAYDNGATKKGLYGVLDKIIKTSSRIAITISEKV